MWHQSCASTRRVRLAAALIVLCSLAGLAIRLALFIRAGWRYDYDEGMVGLQVLRILGGERPIFFLEREGIQHVWTDVGIAHVLMFDTHERILAADWYDIYGARGLVRFPDVPLRIYAAERVAFVEVVLPDQGETPFERAFQRAGVPYRSVRVTPDLLVIIPTTPIDPALVEDGLGYQF